MRRLLAVVGLGLLAGCASVPAPGVSPRTPPGPAAAAATATRQLLYRLVYDGGEGRVPLRVVLRRAGEERFQLAVSDLAGRAVFGVDSVGDRAVLVDHRARIWCVSGPELELTEVYPAELPLAALPRVLGGELPVPSSELRLSGDRADELLDGAGRRWRAVRDGELLVAWTLLDAQGPALWWTRQDDGGILSRRGGGQYRWTLVVAEEATGPLADLVPKGFAEGVCVD
ncbi:MAG: hypothetical protein OEP45_09495 [Acidobacteriota bacterium]|nr:hypothetical protein [Acidobacteriota bacterium]